MSATKVLIVDSDERSRNSLGKLVGGHGYEIAAASSGEQAIKTAAGIAPDIIIMNVKLSGRNGYETTREFTDGAGFDVPIILLTAANTKEAFAAQREWAMKVGAADVLSKPIEEQALLARMRHLTGAPAQAGGVESASDSAPAHRTGLSESEIKKLAHRMAQYIGPIANMLVNKTISESDTRSELYRRLAEHINDQVERERFISWAVNQG